jgi:hypothetical protein
VSTRAKLLDAAILLDDFIEDCGMQPEHWAVVAQSITDMDAGDEFMAQMRYRLNEVFEPLPFHDLNVTFHEHGPFGPMIGRCFIKGKDVKMAIRMAVLGLENSGVPFVQVEPWPTNG